MKKKRYYLAHSTQRLRDAWLKSGLTQGQIAERVGCERKTINSMMTGNYVCNVTVFAKTCKVLGVSADWILYGERRM